MKLFVCVHQHFGTALRVVGPYRSAMDAEELWILNVPDGADWAIVELENPAEAI